MSSKFVDPTAVIQVIGGVYNNPEILDSNDKYVITEEDFTEQFHKIVFGSIFKLHELGAKEITIEIVNDFLSTRPKSYAVFNKEKGNEWLNRVSELNTFSSFDYYYHRLKKFSLLRAYDIHGIDVTEIYDPDNILDTKKKQAQEERIDNLSLEQLANIVDDKIEQIRMQYVDDECGQAYQAGTEVDSLIDRLKKTPEVGVPLYGPLINTVTRGARLRKFYLRSAATGVGKSRSLIADSCYIACNRIYDDTFGCWISNGVAQPTLYITTEQDLEEVQTMMLAFLSAVNEDHILNGTYLEGEEERVREAARILKESPLYVEELPDFSLQDVENKIKKNIREHDVTYIAFDYIHSSLKILEEISQRTGGVRLREDNILFMLSARLKDICNQYGVFIISATQLNALSADNDATPDQNMLRGAKAIADRIDLGMLLLSVTDKDLVALEPIFATNVFTKPNIKMSIYKNRRGRYKGIYLWCTADLGTCRIKPMFATNYSYELIPIENIKIIVEEEEGAF